MKHIATARYPGEIWDFEEMGRSTRRLGGVHLRKNCIDEAGDPLPCVVHNPSGHVLEQRGMPLHYRDDRNIFERICAHGVGHPDPDQFAYWKLAGQDHQIVHGCDGCCAEDLQAMFDQGFEAVGVYLEAAIVITVPPKGSRIG